MPVLKSKKETLTFSLEEMKKLICADLNIAEDKLTVNYKLKDIADDRFGSSPHYVMDEVEVIVDKS